MNTNILQKCVEEIKKDKPDLSYIRGMLETLIEGNFTMTPPTTIPYTPTYPSTPYPYLGGGITNVPYTGPFNGGGSGTGFTTSAPLSDEEINAQKYAGGSVGKVGTV